MDLQRPCAICWEICFLSTKKSDLQFLSFGPLLMHEVPDDLGGSITKRRMGS
jgi:hypothetical protein